MAMNRLLHIIYIFVSFCLLVMVSACDNTPEKAAVMASKKGLEKHLVHPGSVQYGDVVLAKSLDGLKYDIDYDRISEVLVRKAPKPGDYPGVPAPQFKLLVAQAENQFVKNMQNKVDALNAEIAKGLYKDATGVCLEFGVKNNNDGSAEFEKALCLYTEGSEEAECLNIKLDRDKGSLFNIDLAAVCK